ncbi:MAG TPA: hypothetical protein VJ695_08830 [Nitrososphaera sp.]|nr:hypothetical protein [Nitrososphaera sp.]
MSEDIKSTKYTCEECSESYYRHEDLVDHNVRVHGAALGEQVRQSDEIRKQRERE